MATVYSSWSKNWKPSGSSVNKQFRTWLTYTTTNNNDEVVIKASMGIQLNSAVTATFTSSYLHYKVGNGSEISKATSSSDKTSFSSGTLTWTWISTQTITIKKTTTAQTVKLIARSTASSASWDDYFTASTTVAIPALASYVIAYNANDGSGTISNQTKWYGKNLTLASSGFTRTNYTLVGWNAGSTSGTAYNLGATYSANAATTMYARWTLNYTKPTITNLQAFRVASSSGTTESSTGQYIRLQFNFTPGKIGSTNQTLKCTITVNGSSVYSSTNLTGSSFNQVLSGTYSNNTSHTITIKLYDNTDSVGITKTISVNSATFPIDILGNGSAMGIMTPAVSGQLLKIWVDAIYPVGSYYETSKSPTEFNPNTYFGGTWVQEVQGQVHVSAGSSYPVTTTNATAGGSKDAVVVAHTHQPLTANYFLNTYNTHVAGDMGPQDGSGRHYMYQNTASSGNYWASNATTKSAGVSGTNANMMPYRVVYRWWRTA